MPRTAADNNKQVRPEQKAALVQAAALQAADRLKLSKRNSLRVLELLDDPPPANARLSAAALAMPAE